MIDVVFSLEFFLILLLMTIVHELGHGILAFCFGNFKGLSLTWFGGTCEIKLPMHIFDYSIVLWGGFIASYIFVLIFMELQIITPNPLWVFIVIFGSAIDFIMIFTIILKKKENPFFKYITENHVFGISFSLEEKGVVHEKE